MKNFFKEYILAIMIISISVVSIGASLFLLKGGNLGFLKNRLAASVIEVNSAPAGSTITDSEFYAELVDSYNAEKGTSYGYDHVFTDGELASLKTLVIDENGSHYHGNPVQDVSGLSYLTGLESLVLHVAGIQNVDLRNNKALKTLDIDIPALRVLNLFENNSLESVNTSKPTNPGTIIVKKGHDYSYLFGSSTSQDETVKGDSFAIICDKYDLAVGETTSCMVKGKTTEQMTVLVFKLNQNNENISISNVTKLTQLAGTTPHIYYGNIPVNSEFNIISFDVTAVAAGTSKINLTDYDVENEDLLGYIRARDDGRTAPAEEISKTFYINKYVMKDASGNTVSSGKLKTNYDLNIVQANGTYASAYRIAVLGDVRADGIVNSNDVGKAYRVTADTTQLEGLTDAEKYALDWNFDGYYNLLDVNNIYNRNIN